MNESPATALIGLMARTYGDPVCTMNEKEVEHYLFQHVRNDSVYVSLYV